MRALKKSNFGLCGSIYFLQPAIRGHHPVPSCLTTQITGLQALTEEMASWTYSYTNKERLHAAFQQMFPTSAEEEEAGIGQTRCRNTGVE